MPYPWDDETSNQISSYFPSHILKPKIFNHTQSIHIMKSKLSFEKATKMAVVELLRIRDEIDSFIETLEVLEDKELLKDIEQAMKDVEEGNVISFDDLVKELGLEDEIWANFLEKI